MSSISLPDVENDSFRKKHVKAKTSIFDHRLIGFLISK